MRQVRYALNRNTNMRHKPNVSFILAAAAFAAMPHGPAPADPWAPRPDDLLERHPKGHAERTRRGDKILVQRGTYKGRGYVLERWRLQWDRHGEVGPVGLPLRAEMRDTLARVLWDEEDMGQAKYFAT